MTTTTAKEDALAELMRNAHDDHAEPLWPLFGKVSPADPGAATDVVRETSSAIYHVYDGDGHVDIASQQLTFTRGDTFCVPAWRAVTLRNTGSAPAYLFKFDDRPLIDSRGVYRSDRGA
jgi:gentisate 1,2-dioxygenase